MAPPVVTDTIERVRRGFSRDELPATLAKATFAGVVGESFAGAPTSVRFLTVGVGSLAVALAAAISAEN